MRINNRLFRRGDAWFRDTRYKNPVSGLPVRERVFAGATKAEALSAAAQRIRSIQEESENSSRGGNFSREPFEDYARKFLERKEKEIERVTHDQYRYGLTRFAIPVLGRKPICDIDKADLFKVKDAILELMGPETKGKSKNCQRQCKNPPLWHLNIPPLIS